MSSVMASWSFRLLRRSVRNEQGSTNPLCSVRLLESGGLETQEDCSVVLAIFIKSSYLEK